MKIAEAVAALGYEEIPSESLCIAAPIAGRMEHRTLAQCGDKDLGGLKDVYIATGAFRPGSITAYLGRSRDNLVRIFDLAFDFDLTDYLGLSRADLLSASDGELDVYLSALREDAGEVVALCGVPITTWVSTGYGLLALARLVSPDQTRTADAIALHASLVDRVNEVHGSTLADPQVKDAGTRLVRLPGCVNTKGETPRPCVILHELDGDEPLHIDAYGITNRSNIQRFISPPRNLIPKHGKELDKEVEENIALAISNDYIEGSRHGIALGVAGMLAKCFIPRGQAERIIGRIGADDAEIRDRLLAVSTTYARIERGLDVKGYTHLTSFLSPAVLAYVDNALEPFRFKSEIEFSLIPETTSDRAGSTIAPCPEEAFYGWFAAYREIMKPTTEACDAYHLGVALAYTGLLAGRRVSTHLGRTLYPNLFLTLVGETGKSRKDTAMSRGQSFFQSPVGTAEQMFSHPFSTLRGVTSGEGLIDHLSENPRTILYLSELSTMVRRARRQGTLTLMPVLTELWDANPRIDLSRAGKDGLRGVDRPFLALLAATTPQTLADDMSGADIESGFANRVLWVFGETDAHISRPPRPDEARSRRLYNELRAALALYPDGTSLELDDHAGQMWDDWYDRFKLLAFTNEIEAQMAQRMGANIHRIALIYAASEGASFIDEHHLGAATAFVEWTFASTRAHARRWGWGDDAKLGTQILDCLGFGPVRNTDIAKFLGERVGAPQLQKVLKALLETGQVALCAPGVYARSE
jgi:hypothetical protein